MTHILSNQDDNSVRASARTARPQRSLVPSVRRRREEEEEEEEEEEFYPRISRINAEECFEKTSRGAHKRSQRKILTTAPNKAQRCCVDELINTAYRIFKASKINKARRL